MPIYLEAMTKETSSKTLVIYDNVEPQIGIERIGGYSSIISESKDHGIGIFASDKPCQKLPKGLVHSAYLILERQADGWHLIKSRNAHINSPTPEQVLDMILQVSMHEDFSRLQEWMRPRSLNQSAPWGSLGL